MSPARPAGEPVAPAANLVPVLRGLTLLVLLANAAGLLTPVVDAGDSVTYAALAQHMAVTGDWVNLMLDGQDWLDKPHFPFWLTALSFRLFGVSAFSYNLPGFLFHLLAAFYTYRLARRWHDREVAWLAVLVFVSAFQVMLTSSAVRAEAYLTGSIMAACHAWLRHDDRPGWKPLLAGAFFSATAIMTKGVFTLITIASGLLALWIWQRRWSRLWSPQWWAALALTLLFTLPEMVALYLQFDAQPAKQVFGRTGVSGIGFFWWDSQFGRFFNTGPIRNTDGSLFFFLHVFLWAFLPWVPAFFAALGGGPRRSLPAGPAIREARVFLWASFGLTFLLFSLTRFQLDYYTVILFPFAAILCAPVLADALRQVQAHRRLAWAHVATGCLGALLALGMAAWVGQPALPALLGGLAAVAGVAGLMRWRGAGPGTLSLLGLPVAGVLLLYLFITLLTARMQATVGLAWNAHQALRSQPAVPVQVLGMPLVARELALYHPASVRSAPDVAALPRSGPPYHLVLPASALPALQARALRFEPLAQGRWAIDKTGLLPRTLALARGTEPLDDIRILRVQPDTP